MIRKVVVFAAGRGTRMRALSKQTPKHLIQIFGKPFLYYLLSNLRQAGFEEIVMVTGYLSEQMEKFVSKHRHEFPLFTTVNQFELLGEEMYGTLMPLIAAQDQVKDENFIVVMGDNLYSLTDLQAFRKQDDTYCYVGGFEVPNPEQYGTLVSSSDGYLQSIDERSSHPISNVINSALYKFTPEIFTKVDQVDKSPRGEYEITDAVTILADEHKVKVLPLQEYWLDFGKPEDIEELENFIRNNNLFETYGIKKS